MHPAVGVHARLAVGALVSGDVVASVPARVDARQTEGYRVEVDLRR